MATTERVLIAQPLALAGGRIIASPFQLYTTGEDRLRVVSVNSKTGVTLKVQARLIDAAGVISANAWDHLPAADRTLRSDDYEIGVGAVLNVNVFANAGTPTIGQTFVILQLVRGFGTAAIVLGTLLQGYVTGSQALGWPGSPIVNSIEGSGQFRRIFGTFPAAGGEIAETVPTGVRWQLLTVTAFLNTSVAAGARAPNLLLDDGATPYAVSPQPVALGPAATLRYCWSVSLPLAAAVGTLASVAGLIEPNRLLAGHRFFTTTTNLQAADQWSVPCYLVQEWLEVL